MTDKRVLTLAETNILPSGGIVNPAVDIMQNTELDSEPTWAELKPVLTAPALYDISTNCQSAVSLRHAYKKYGSKKNPIQVLQNFNMTVSEGSIYGLLGASGCGKTTLLSCIVGRRRLDSGDILVLGGKPGTKGSGVPGKRVGYMPQEMALFGEFTIRETMLYFGWIFDMGTDQIDKKMEFLLKFLDLPPQERYVKSLSGGQQRRVSFAVALIHDPELLILDEPTVGVDPLLRGNIWDYLVQLTKTGKKTVIITTHYIEEARQAHTIGLMRSGELLAEHSPQALLTMYNCLTLEEVFLKLSRNQGENSIVQKNTMEDTNLEFSNRKRSADPEGEKDCGKVFGDQLNLNVLQSSNDSNQGDYVMIRKNSNLSSCLNFTSTGKLKALLRKNFLGITRSIGMMLFIFALPMIQVNLFCLSFGGDPSDLRIAIVNHEMNWENKSCPSDKWGCNYVNSLSNKTIVKEYYETPELANEAVRKGNAWATVYITENFTTNLMAGAFSLDDTSDHTDIRVWMDMSNQQISFSLSRLFQQGFQDFAKSLAFDLPQSPVRFENPIYGSMDTTHTSFVAPGVILTVVFFFTLSLTSSTLIGERTEGLLDRSWVAGVSFGEILFSHIITHLFVVCVQTVSVHIFVVLVYKVECNGDIVWVVALTLLQGICGMCYGFVISSVCDLERNAMQLAMGSFYPSILLSGIMWPAEGMPMALRYISDVLPLTLATSSLRSMMTRGWSITEFGVYIGFVSTIAWILILLTISMIVLKFKRN